MIYDNRGKKIEAGMTCDDMVMYDDKGYELIEGISQLGFGDR